MKRGQGGTAHPPCPQRYRPLPPPTNKRRGRRAAGRRPRPLSARAFLTAPNSNRRGGREGRRESARERERERARARARGARGRAGPTVTSGHLPPPAAGAGPRLYPGVKGKGKGPGRGRGVGGKKRDRRPTAAKRGSTAGPRARWRRGAVARAPPLPH